MAIQFERRPMESLETLAPPQRPARKNQFKPVQQNSVLDSPNHQIHKFWSPKIAHQTQPMKQATEDIKGTKLSSLAQVIKKNYFVVKSYIPVISRSSHFNTRTKILSI